ncbi:hypothetical protein F5J12DRAFT_786398 [Pisolithus orientalis]|uniref:uncharacterized protein n=1 Tax=Pisolithus orientalis TaxID=936130 RepID=UPI002224D960|nr:uncharacterized protein F5J12DRAFT_786398 [Pisolithus orientalis]KAI5991062.1 hypothetical protein F5J12DRAFT_786398 [Pisolithus orientalis]
MASLGGSGEVSGIEKGILDTRRRWGSVLGFFGREGWKMVSFMKTGEDAKVHVGMGAEGGIQNLKVLEDTCEPQKRPYKMFSFRWCDAMMVISVTYLRSSFQARSQLPVPEAADASPGLLYDWPSTDITTSTPASSKHF